MVGGRAVARTGRLLRAARRGRASVKPRSSSVHLLLTRVGLDHLLDLFLHRVQVEACRILYGGIVNGGQCEVVLLPFEPQRNARIRAP